MVSLIAQAGLSSELEVKFISINCTPNRGEQNSAQTIKIEYADNTTFTDVLMALRKHRDAPPWVQEPIEIWYRSVDQLEKPGSFVKDLFAPKEGADRVSVMQQHKVLTVQPFRSFEFTIQDSRRNPTVVTATSDATFGDLRVTAANILERQPEEITQILALGINLLDQAYIGTQIKEFLESNQKAIEYFWYN